MGRGTGPIAFGGIDRVRTHGREALLERIDTSLEQWRGALLIGPPGAGRTHIARHIARRVAANRPSGTWADIAWATASTTGGCVTTALGHRLPNSVDALGLADGQLATELGSALGQPDIGRTLLLVDDAHLLSTDDAQLIAELVLDTALVVLLTCRSDRPLADALTELVDDDVIARIGLDPPARDDAIAIAADLLGEAAGDRAAHLWSTTGGNLVLLTELARAEALAPSGPAGAALTLTDRICELVDGLLAELPAAWRRGLDLLAVAEPMPTDLLTTVVDPAVHAGLSSLGLIGHDGAPSNDQVTVHPTVVGEVIRRSMPPIRRADLLSALVGALQRTATDRRDDVIRMASWHLDAADPFDPELLTRAAHHATWSFDPQLGQRLAEVALAVDAGPDAAVALVRALVAQGRDDEAVLVASDTWEDTSWVASRTADPDAVARPLLQLWVTALDRGLGRPHDALATLDRLVDDRTDPRWRAFIDAMRADVLRRLDRVTAARIGAGVPTGANDPLARVIATRAVVEQLSAQGRCEDALAELDLVADDAERVAADHPAVRTMLAGARAGVLGDAGRLDELMATMWELLDHAEELDHAISRGGARMGLGLGAFHGGHMRAAIAHLGQALDELETADPYDLEPWITSVLTAAHAILGDHAGTSRWLNRARAARAAAPHDVSLGVWFATGEAWAAASLDGRAAGAAVALSAAAVHDSTVGRALLGALAHRLGAPLVQTMPHMTVGRGAQSRLLVAITAHADALGEPVSGDGLHEAALAYHGTGFLLHAAETWIEAAESYRDRGVGSRARAAEQRARELLSGPLAGATTPIVLRLLAPRLTDRERQVAVEAARGRSNVQIAELLGRSIRTVESHLAQAYMKLGVIDRRQLAEVLNLGEVSHAEPSR